MDEITEQECYEGVEVDLIFDGRGPMFGDLFTICGFENPNFPPSREFPFEKFEDLQYSQVDDYFGVETLSDEGDDIAVWLYPLVNGQIVDHHPGPTFLVQHPLIKCPSYLLRDRIGWHHHIRSPGIIYVIRLPQVVEIGGQNFLHGLFPALQREGDP